MEALKNNIYRFYLVDFAFNEGAKIGTYGMIKGAKAYLVGIMKSSKGSDVHASFDFGCDFEKNNFESNRPRTRNVLDGGNF